MQHLNSFLLILTLILSSETTLASDFAAEAKYKKSPRRKLTVADNPRPNGVKKITTGILTASIGHVIGLSILFTAAYSEPCEAGTLGNRCRSRKRTNDQLGNGLTLGAPLVGAGIIVSGVRDRYKWKDWNKKNIEDDASLTRDADFQSVQDAARLIRVASTRPNLSLNLISFNF